MNFVSVKHPLVFFGIPSIGFLYISVFETLEASNLSQISIGGLAKFGTNFVASPFFLISIAFSIGSALLFNLKHLGKLSGQEK